MSGPDAVTEDGEPRAPTEVELERRGGDALRRLLAHVPAGPGAPAPREGDALGGATLVSVLGRGGMGEVWRARDAALGRDVAVKVLRRITDPADLVRFRAEGEAAARLRHPHVVRVHAAGEERGWPFLVLDLVEGESLARRLDRQGPLAPRAAVEVARALASALAHAHERGVVHRDVKPANVLLDPDGAPRLADFGLARDLHRDARLTPSGVVVGTPAYMAPEQLDGRPVDARADVWSLGATLHECLTGAPPWRGLAGPPLLLAMERGPPPTGLDRGLDAILGGCLAFAPGERYPGAAALEADLVAWLAGRSPRPPVRRRGRRAVVVAAALALVAALALAGAPRLAGPPPLPAPPPRPPSPPRPPIAAPGEDPEPARRAPALAPRAACEALQAEILGGPSADLDAIGAGLTDPRTLEDEMFVARARVLADRVLELRVARTVGADADAADVDARLAAHGKAARLIGVAPAAIERMAKARVQGLAEGRLGERLREAVEAGAAGRIRSLVAAACRTARVEPALTAARRLELARGLRAAVWRGHPPKGRADAGHRARVVLEDALFYELAPEAPLGEGLEWCRDVQLAFLEDGVSAEEGLALLRGHRGDSWADVQSVVRATAGVTPELSRRASRGSAAARLLRLLVDLTWSSSDAETLRRLVPALQGVRSAPIVDLPPGLRAATHIRLGRALVDSGGDRAEAEALAREALGQLEALDAAEGLLTERLSGALVVVLYARSSDVAALTSAAREGLAWIERHEQATNAATASSPELAADRAVALRLARANLLVELVELLGDRCPDPEGAAWVARTEVAAAAAGKHLETVLLRRAHRLELHLGAGRPRQALDEADACWRAIDEALVPRLAAADPADVLRRAKDALCEAAARAADQAGDPDKARWWRAVAQGL